ncbi:MAG: GC-type dockerin domain-anchored protein [Phycisphaerales bacterium]
MRPRTVHRLTIGALSAAAIGLALPAAADGPDVIVGELSDVLSYGTDAANPGVFAYAVGTTSCNRGTDTLSWRTGGNENRHPVIGQNLYKLDNGRIIQLGQSWLKHGFTALQGNACGLGCIAHPNGTALGVGCSDPYSASLNGSQSSLGAKSEVNAATGVFPYPQRLLPPFSGNTPKRLQLKSLELPGSPTALYFVEGQYIAQDDAAAGNSANNASYRRVTFSASAPYTMSLQGTTQREKPAILAWRDHGSGLNTPDPAVFIAPQDIPQDGRMILGWKVSQTGPATWRYEYAVQNLTSDRCGQAFSVPFPPGTAITNAGWHGVDSHSGERWNNATPWTQTIGVDSISWSGPAYSGTPGIWNSATATWTEPTGNDSTANALRWGTLYNFWFEADIGPGSIRGGVSMPLFRPPQPGAPAQITWSAQTPGGASIGAQANDLCANARAIGPGTTAFSNAAAGTDGPAACNDNGSDLVWNDVWFKYTSTCDGSATLSTCGSEFDTRLAVYAGSACPTVGGGAPLVACNDNSAAACGAGSLSSHITFPLANGQTYLIRVGSTGQFESGNGLLNLTACPTSGACCAVTGICSLRTPAGCTGTFLGLGVACSPNPCPPPVRPANDDCVNALSIGDSAIGQPTISGNTILATADGPSSCANAANSPSVWFAYVPAVSGPVTVDMCVGDYDTALAVFSGPCATPTQVGCDDDACGALLSRISNIPMTAGTRYLLRASGYAGQTGTFTIRVTGGGGVAVMGACCTGSSCAVVAPGACASGYAGDNTTCGAPGNPTTCCRANFNAQNGVTVQDIFDYLAAYFDQQPEADFDASGSVTLDDVFAFVTAWFSGCP